VNTITTTTDTVETMYTRAELAATWRLSARTIDRARADGALAFLKIGRSVRFPESAVLQWLNNLAR